MEQQGKIFLRPGTKYLTLWFVISWEVYRHWTVQGISCFGGVEAIHCQQKRSFLLLGAGRLPSLSVPREWVKNIT